MLLPLAHARLSQFRQISLAPTAHRRRPARIREHDRRQDQTDQAPPSI